MPKDLVKEAYEQVDIMKESAMENAKNVLVQHMSTDLKAAVSKAMNESLNEGSDVPPDYHEGKKGEALGNDRLGDEIPAQGDTPNDDPAEKGEGPAIVETGIEEYDISEEDDDLPFDDVDDEEDDDDDMDMDMDMEDDDEDDDEDDVIEVIEAEDMDFDDEEEDDDEEVEETYAKYESAFRSLKAENKKLRLENKRQNKALVRIKDQMDEINLFNARLAGASDLMRRVTLTNEQKESVVEHFDKCRSVGEVKRAHRMMLEGYRSNRKKVRATRPNVQSVVSESVEVNNKFGRLAELAGVK